MSLEIIDQLKTFVSDANRICKTVADEKFVGEFSRKFLYGVVHESSKSVIALNFDVPEEMQGLSEEVHEFFAESLLHAVRKHMKTLLDCASQDMAAKIKEHVESAQMEIKASIAEMEAELSKIKPIE